MKPLITIFTLSFLVFSVQANFLANLAFDGFISLFRSNFDPMPIADKEFTLSDSMPLPFQVASQKVSFTRTILAGLRNLSRIGDTVLSFGNGSIAGTVTLGVSRLILTSLITPSLGTLLPIGTSLPAKLTTDYLEINITLVTNTWFGNPKLTELKIGQLKDVQIELDYGRVLQPLSTVAHQLVNESIIKLLNGAFRSHLEVAIKANINAALKYRQGRQRNLVAESRTNKGGTRVPL